MNICQWESCVQSGCRVCSPSIKNNNNASTIQSVVCNCFNATKRSFCVSMWQWIKHGSTTSFESAVSWVDSSREKLSKATKDANISTQGFGLRILECARYFVHRLPWERKNHQLQILYSIIGAFEGRNRKKTATNKEKKYQDNALCQKLITTIAKITWIVLRIASAPTLFSISSPHRLLAVCRPQKNAPGKEIWLQWRIYIGNCGIFWGQRQIVL